MDSQTIINYAFGLIGFFGGWVLKVVWESLTALQMADKSLADKVATIEILVAGSYVTKDEFTKTLSSLFAKLDRIEDKIDRKMDK